MLRLSSAFQRINEHPGPQSAFPESPSFSRLIQCLMPPLSHFVSFRPTPCSKERLSRRLLQNTPEIWAFRQRRSLTAMACTPPWLFPMPARARRCSPSLVQCCVLRDRKSQISGVFCNSLRLNRSFEHGVGRKDTRSEDV